MAVAQVYQREVVEVPFSLPDGQILPHPALVISCDDLQNIEPGLFYAVLISTKNHHPELTIPIQGEWLSSPSLSMPPPLLTLTAITCLSAGGSSLRSTQRK